MKLSRLLALISAVLSSAVHAQELGLDLTEPSTPSELRPSIVFIGVTPLGTDKDVVNRAHKAQAALFKTLDGKDQFSKVLPPAEAQTALEPEAKAAARCSEKACFEKIADRLDMDRVVVGTVGQASGETRLTLYGFDRGTGKITVHTADSAEQAVRRQLSGISGIAGKSQAQKDAEFLRRAQDAMSAASAALKTPLGILSVRSYDASVDVRLNGRKIGTGGFTKNIPAGSYTLRAESPSVMPFETKVTVESLKAVEVPLTLVAREETGPSTVVASNRKAGPSIFSRPGFYAAVAGAVAIGVGGYLGAQAKGIEKRATDVNGDGVLDITRVEAETAKRNALIANVLMGAGGAGVLGGGLWMFLTPTVGSGRPGDEPMEGGGMGLSVAAGGSF